MSYAALRQDYRKTRPCNVIMCVVHVHILVLTFNWLIKHKLFITKWKCEPAGFRDPNSSRPKTGSDFFLGIIGLKKGKQRLVFIIISKTWRRRVEDRRTVVSKIRTNAFEILDNNKQLYRINTECRKSFKIIISKLTTP